MRARASLRGCYSFYCSLFVSPLSCKVRFLVDSAYKSCLCVCIFSPFVACLFFLGSFNFDESPFIHVFF